MEERDLKNPSHPSQNIGAVRAKRRDLLRLTALGLTTAAIAGGESAAATAQGAETAGQPGGTLTIVPYASNRGASHAFNCRLRSAGSPADYAMAAMGSALVWRGWGDVGLEYDLAESHQELEKDRVFEFKLRPNAKWHDGTPVTAEDIVWSFYIYGHRDTNHAREDLSEIKGWTALKTNGGGPEVLTGVTRVDDLTVRIELEEPSWNWIALKLAQLYPMFPAHLYKQVPPEAFFDQCSQQPQILSGPFKFGRIVDGQYTEMERFDDYHLGKPLLDRVIHRVITDPATLDAAIEAGDVDAATAGSIDSYKQMQENSLLVTTPMMNQGSWGPRINFTRFREWGYDLPAQILIKKAMMTAVDRQAIVNEILGGAGFNFEYLWQAIPWLNPPPTDLVSYSYDPQQAQAYLQEADWDSSRELKFVGYAAPTPYESFMLQQWNDVGLKVVFEQADPAVAVQRSYEEVDWDVTTWGAWTKTDVWYVRNSYQSDMTYASGTGWNPDGFSDPQVDEYWARADEAAPQGEDALKVVLQDFARYWNETLPVVTMFYLTQPFVYHSRVQSPVPLLEGARPNAWRIPFEKISITP